MPNLPLPPVTVRLVQISQPVGENMYLPYSVGLLQAYALQNLPEPGHFRFLPPLYRRLLRPEAMQALAEVDIAGFSVYVWNIRRSLMLAAALKQEKPGTLILFGGPQVPDRAEDFLRAHPYIDLVSHGAGEELFSAVLRQYPGRDWQDVPGLSWIDQAGNFRHTPPAPRRRDLSDYPSPFLTGVFDPLLAEHGNWFSPFETNRGCPFTCTFCDWGSAIGTKLARFPDDRIWAEIAWMGRHRIKSLTSVDANFGILPRDLEIAREVARVRAECGFPQAFLTQAAKNITGRVVEIQKVLTDAGLSATAAISLQSLDAHTLRSIKRENISLEAFRQIHKACLAEGIFTYTDLIMSLPGETYESFVTGIETLIDNGQYNKVLFHDTILLPNAEMAQPEYRQAYGFETVEVAVHGHTALSDGLPELMEIVVATRDIPREDWVRMHVFAWMTAFLFYSHRLLQFVLIVLHQRLGCSWRSLITLFIDTDLSALPLLARILHEFETTARRQQLGYPHSQEDSLIVTPVEGTYLSPELTMQMKLGAEGLIDQFYAEAAALLVYHARSQDPDFPLTLLEQTFALNRSHFVKSFKTHGFPLKGIRTEPVRVDLCYNLPEFFESVFRDQPIEIALRAPVGVML
ncbi:MAG: radical SAM protein [Candidatus Sericytochromatia bacterium]